MSKERDHHYVPQFHLSKWANDEGKITQWGRIPYNGKLVSKPVTAAATAYVPGLYALEQVNDEEAQQIEIRILGKIETEAQPVLERLISTGPRGLSVRDRYWWTVYLNASLIRVPHIVEKVKTEVAEGITRDLSQDTPAYDAARGNAPEATLYEWAVKNAPARVANAGLKVLVSLIGSEKAIDRIIHLEWMVNDVSAASRRLLLGDDPFERVGDLYGPRTAISIPLSPTRLFIASNAPDIIDHFEKMPARTVVKANNQSSLINAKQFVYGEAERAFVDQYLLRSQSVIESVRNITLAYPLQPKRIMK
ncbi:DUF4238 domain-containing protein [Kaistia geumhonensis]|uniref:DUF4238 domain-containing protein n=1 Tax=Kaistia geumhonensis TaxID=410839 RepID=A0ABU0M145_9HYPH|nr:DUF4238 domain-containing protein [Kaistia geumhonensis]MCX5480196.1 DUF4238 domain-containing protein [Kaistia geumhonensis]MDQ0514575.1 hypothetical protein [Kaistia geumhonensis]